MATQRVDAIGVSPTQSPATAPDAQLTAPDASAPSDAVSARDGGALSVDSGLDSGTADEDAGVTPPMPPPVNMTPMMMGGLQCAGVFCPFTTDPVQSCCTTAADVSQHAARAADRCGVNLGQLDAKAYGAGCWQRDQLGIIDDRCPAAMVTAAADENSAEPGCCADDGQCGTNNADQKLGCRHALGGTLHACGERLTGGACDPTGIYGFKATVDTYWPGRGGGLLALTDDGRGKLEVYLLIRIEQVDAATSKVVATGRVCGFDLPAFYSTTLCESYQTVFPTRIWESSTVPKLSLTGRYECAAQGCVLSVDPSTYLLGFDMPNPEAPWPTSDQTTTVRCAAGTGSKCFPDHDNDGLPGVQVELLTSGTAPPSTGCSGKYDYKAAPLNDSVAAIFGGVRRADRLLLGARMRLAVSARLGEDCATGQGSALAEYVNSRAPGCFVQQGTRDFPGVAAGANEACNMTESHFIDQSLPVYTLLSAGQKPAGVGTGVDASPSKGPQVGVVRFGPLSQDVSCEAIRNANY
jgi:hypothetical protein